MQTHQESLKGCTNYGGEIIPNEYKILLARRRDSDCLIESNWRVALDMLGGESDNVRIDRFGHWACGWFEYISVKINTPQFTIAEKIESDIEDYPVLDDDDFCELECDEANRIWKNCYDATERIEYIRENRNEFDFCSFPHMLEVARGKYFNGYASELLA